MKRMLENKILKAEIAAKGAEITRVVSKQTGLEYMWDGDETYWGYHSPIMFPMINNSKNGGHLFGGQLYYMKNHGFARLFTFRPGKSGDDAAVFYLDSTGETLAQYPFEFRLAAEYRLEGSAVLTEIKVENRSDIQMPFTVGLHPAFNCPLNQGEAFSDYRIEFEKKEDRLPKDVQALFAGSNNLPLSYGMIEEASTLRFKDLQSDYVTLTNGKNGVRLDLAWFPNLMIWTKAKEKAPFICIEPCHGSGLRTEADSPFENRDGIVNLPPGEIFQIGTRYDFF